MALGGRVPAEVADVLAELGGMVGEERHDAERRQRDDRDADGAHPVPLPTGRRLRRIRHIGAPRVGEGGDAADRGPGE